jgi:hypothetical protein
MIFMVTSMQRACSTCEAGKQGAYMMPDLTATDGIGVKSSTVSPMTAAHKQLLRFEDHLP